MSGDKYEKLCGIIAPVYYLEWVYTDRIYLKA